MGYPNQRCALFIGKTNHFSLALYVVFDTVHYCTVHTLALPELNSSLSEYWLRCPKPSSTVHTSRQDLGIYYFISSNKYRLHMSIIYVLCTF